MGWVLSSETFFLVAGVCYLAMVCVEAMLSAVGSDEACAEKSGSSERTCSDECMSSSTSTTFVVAFLAGGFLNLERICGLPVP